MVCSIRQPFDPIGIVYLRMFPLTEFRACDIVNPTRPPLGSFILEVFCCEQSDLSFGVPPRALLTLRGGCRPLKKRACLGVLWRAALK